MADKVRDTFGAFGTIRSFGIVLLGFVAVLICPITLQGCESALDYDKCGTEDEAQTYHPDKRLHAYPSFLAQNNTGPITPVGHACSTRSGCTKKTCHTIYGKETCTANLDRTLRGFKCRGGDAYGGVCGLWRTTRWQALYENAFSATRQAWCYTHDGEGGGWDYCHGQQTYERWAPRQPCIPWNKLSTHRKAYGELVHNKLMCPEKGMNCYTRSSSRRRGTIMHKTLCEVTKRYAPSENQWYEQTIPADAGCAVPAFSFFPAKRETTPRKMVDISGKYFTGAFCYTSTSGGPRPVQCDDVCGVKGCNGHGICSGNARSFGKYTCKCHHGWKGADCSVPVNRSITCREIQAMGLDDGGESMMYNIIVMPAFALRYGVSAGLWDIFLGSAPLLVKAGLLCVKLGWIAIVIGIALTLAWCKAEPVMLGAGCGLALFVTVWLSLIPILLFALFFFPMLAYLKWWSFDRAILLCVGPIGINWLALPLFGFLGDVFVATKKYCWQEVTNFKDAAFEAKNETMQKYHLDWMMAAGSLLMQWSSLASGLSTHSSLHSTMVAGIVSVGSLQLFSSVLSTIILLGKAVLVFGATSTRNMPIYLVKQNIEGPIFWVAVTLVAMQNILVNSLQIAIAVASPFFMGNFVPDFTLYSGMFSIYLTRDTLNVLLRNVDEHRDALSSPLLH